MHESVNLDLLTTRKSIKIREKPIRTGYQQIPLIIHFSLPLPDQFIPENWFDSRFN